MMVNNVIASFWRGVSGRPTHSVTSPPSDRVRVPASEPECTSDGSDPLLGSDSRLDTTDITDGFRQLLAPDEKRSVAAGRTLSAPVQAFLSRSRSAPIAIPKVAQHQRAARQPLRRGFSTGNDSERLSLKRKETPTDLMFPFRLHSLLNETAAPDTETANTIDAGPSSQHPVTEWSEHVTPLTPHAATLTPNLTPQDDDATHMKHILSAHASAHHTQTPTETHTQTQTQTQKTQATEKDLSLGALSAETSPKKPKPRPFRCRKCLRSFTSKMNLDQHFFCMTSVDAVMMGRRIGRELQQERQEELKRGRSRR